MHDFEGTEMKVNILEPPESDIFRERKKYTFWFVFFLVLASIGVGIGVYAIYYDTHHIKNLDDIALGVLVGASVCISWSGNKLQAYKKLFPPQKEKIMELRGEHPAIETYCAQVEKTRYLIRAEYEACTEYAEDHKGVPFV